MCHISFCSMYLSPNTGYIMHTARWAENDTKNNMKNLCKCYVTHCTNVPRVPIPYKLHYLQSYNHKWYNMCFQYVPYKFLQHVPVPHTGYIMHTARCKCKCKCKCLCYARFVPVFHTQITIVQTHIFHKSRECNVQNDIIQYVMCSSDTICVLICAQYATHKTVFAACTCFPHTGYIMQTTR